MSDLEVQAVLEGRKRGHRVPARELREGLKPGDLLLIGTKTRIQVTEVWREDHGNQAHIGFKFDLFG